MATETAKREGRTRAEIFWRIEAIANGEIGPLPRPLNGADFKRLAALHLEGLPMRHGLAADLRLHMRAGKNNGRIGAEMQRRPCQRHFERGRARLVADETVRQLKGKRVHRPRGWHADIPIADASRIILNRRLRARCHHVDRCRPEVEMGERRRAHRTIKEGPGARELAQVIEIGLDAIDGALIERRGELRHGFRAGCALDDDLGEHRIVEGRDLGSRRDPAIDTHGFGKTHLREQARRRLEVPCRIFSIEPHFDGVALRRALILCEITEIAGGLPHHHLDEIEAGHLLRHRMLDLKPRVHFEEVEFLFRRIIDELDGPRRFVSNGFAKTHGRLLECAAHIIRQIGRWCFFDHFLVTALRRAVAFTKRDDPALAIAKYLHLDVARFRDELLKEHAAVLEVRKAEALHRFEETRKFRRRLAELQADAAAARRALDHDGIADGTRTGERIVEVGNERRARQQRHATLLGKLARRMLQREGQHVFGTRADKGNTPVGQRLREAGVLAQKSIARMHGFRAGRNRSRDDRIDIEIALRDHGGANADRLVRQVDMRREAIGFGIDSDRADAHAAECANDAAGDFAAVRNKYLLEHVFLPERQPFQISVRMGVGLKSLQGLLTCGQFEMTHSTSISARSST